MWDIYMLFVVAYSIFSTLLIVAFMSDDDLSPTTRNINNAVTYCFAVDIVLTFFCEYQDQETFKMIKDHKLIAKRYLRGSLIIDLIATIPFEWFGGDTGVGVTKLLRLSRLSRLWALLD